MEQDADAMENGGKRKSQFKASYLQFTPAKVDRRLKDDDEVKLGGSTLTANLMISLGLQVLPNPFGRMTLFFHQSLVLLENLFDSPKTRPHFLLLPGFDPPAPGWLQVAPGGRAPSSRFSKPALSLARFAAC